MDGKRLLIVTADDFGIGPATSEGILDLALQGRVTATVLLVCSPHAGHAVRAWRQQGCPLEVGWHPCLTLDRPVLPPSRVPTLVGADGCFHPLGRFLRKLLLGRLRVTELRAELQAQYERFHDLVGGPPTLVNSHHHVQVFSPIGRLLGELLARQRPRPYVRRVCEPGRTLTGVPGARVKRLVLSGLGSWDARNQAAGRFPGNDWLAGITDPPCVAEPDFLTRWLLRVPGRVVELTCHPGYEDASLVGRDCEAGDAQMKRRPHEWRLLSHPEFLKACRRAGFTLAAPQDLVRAGRLCAA